MKIFSALFVLASLGVLSATSAAAVDTSQWKCETCPYPKGSSGTVDAGVGYVSDESAKFGDYSGLKRKGAYADLGGRLMVRGEQGYFADLAADRLGLDSRSLAAQSGREGLYSLRLAYAEMPRHFAEGARTPFVGNGGSVLTPSPGATLQPVDLGFKAKRLDLGGAWIGQENWVYRVSLRRDMRDGTKPTAGSMFSTTSQLAAPVDHVTNQLEVAASYVTQRLQASLAYQLSQFRNGRESLTWDNPFPSIVAGDSRGQLALAPDNQFHQILGSAGYLITPTIRASADFAVGRMTQNADYLASTVNASLGVPPLPPLPSLPSPSLDGVVDTFNGSVKLTATPMDGLRVNAIYARDVRDNRTAVQSYPVVSTDTFLSAAPRSNTPFSFTQDRFKLNADYRGPATWRLSGGIDVDYRDRTYQEAVTTREATLWGRASVQALEGLGLAFNLAHGNRSSSTYGVAYWFPPENPLLRKYNLAARQRDTAGARADWAVSEKVSLGLGVEFANDDYDETVIGLNKVETLNLAADITVALSEQTSVHAFAQGERMRSRQTGSQAFAAPDWTGRITDRYKLLTVGVNHAAIPNKLDLGADLSFSRSRSGITVQTGVGEPPFPSADTSVDTLKVHATYRLKDNLSLTGSYWYEYYQSQDWRLDGVLPTNVPGLLAFGDLPPRYRVNVVRLGLRYRF
jgi:MtrB/PioB family decaheme-associated outer membrane protein